MPEKTTEMKAEAMGEDLKQLGQRCLLQKSADLKPTLKSGMRQEVKGEWVRRT